MNSLLKHYIRQVSTYLPCNRKARIQIINEIRTSLSAYLEQNPGATADSISQRFGTPQQIAASYVDEMDTAALLHSLRKRRKIVAALILVITLALTAFTTFLSTTVVEAYNCLNGYSVITGP